MANLTDIYKVKKLKYYPLIISPSHTIKIVTQDKGTKAICLGIRTHKNYPGKCVGICISSVNKQKEQYAYRKYMSCNINKHEYKQFGNGMSENAGKNQGHPNRGF